MGVMGRMGWMGVMGRGPNEDRAVNRR
jgi:hypothetical protein